jgi:conjugative transfer region protein TrbK
MKAARLLAYLVLAAMALDAARGVAQQPSNGQTSPPAATDPLAKELQRCRELNEKAEADPGCQAAYQEVRKRFFTHSDTYHPVPIQMYPGGPEPKLVKPDQDPSK